MDKREYTVGDLLGLLESPSQEVSEEVKSLLKETFMRVKDPWLVSGLLEYFYVSNSCRLLDLVVGVSEPHDRHLLDKILDGLRGNDRFRHTYILLYAVRRQPPPMWIRKLLDHPVLKELFNILLHDENVPILFVAVLILVVLLPVLPFEFGRRYMHPILDIFNRLVRWSPRRDFDDAFQPFLQVAVYSLFHRLYALYPHNFLASLKVNFSKPGAARCFFSTLRPMIEKVRLHPVLVTETRDSEISRNRWVGLETHQLILECAKLCIDPIEATCEDPPGSHFVLSDSEVSGLDQFPAPTNWLFYAVENNFWSPSLAIATPGVTPGMGQGSSGTPMTRGSTSTPVTPIFPVTPSLKGRVAESPPEAAIEATPDTTPFTSPIKLDHGTNSATFGGTSGTTTLSGSGASGMNQATFSPSGTNSATFGGISTSGTTPLGGSGTNQATFSLSGTNSAAFGGSGTNQATSSGTTPLSGGGTKQTTFSPSATSGTTITSSHGTKPATFSGIRRPRSAKVALSLNTTEASEAKPYSPTPFKFPDSSSQDNFFSRAEKSSIISTKLKQILKERQMSTVEGEEGERSEIERPEREREKGERVRGERSEIERERRGRESERSEIEKVERGREKGEEDSERKKGERSEIEGVERGGEGRERVGGERSKIERDWEREKGDRREIEREWEKSERGLRESERSKIERLGGREKSERSEIEREWEKSERSEIEREKELERRERELERREREMEQREREWRESQRKAERSEPKMERSQREGEQCEKILERNRGVLASEASQKEVDIGDLRCESSKVSQKEGKIEESKASQNEGSLEGLRGKTSKARQKDGEIEDLRCDPSKASHQPTHHLHLQRARSSGSVLSGGIGMGRGAVSPLDNYRRRKQSMYDNSGVDLRQLGVESEEAKEERLEGKIDLERERGRGGGKIELGEERKIELEKTTSGGKIEVDRTASGRKVEEVERKIELERGVKIEGVERVKRNLKNELDKKSEISERLEGESKILEQKSERLVWKVEGLEQKSERLGEKMEDFEQTRGLITDFEQKVSENAALKSPIRLIERRISEESDDIVHRRYSDDTKTDTKYLTSDSSYSKTDTRKYETDTSYSKTDTKYLTSDSSYNKTDTTRKFESDTPDTRKLSAETVSDNSDDGSDAGDIGLGVPCLSAFPNTVKNLRIMRLRFLSQCGPPPDLSHLNTRIATSPVKLGLLGVSGGPASSGGLTAPLKKSNSCPDLDCIKPQPAIEGRVRKESAMSSLTLSPIRQAVITCEASTQTEDTGLVNPYEQLLDALKPPGGKGERSEPTHASDASPSPHELLDQYLTLSAKVPAKNLLWQKTENSGTQYDALKNQVRLMRALLLIERYKREVHAEHNRRLLGRAKRVYELEEQRNGLRDHSERLEDEMSQLAIALEHSSAQLTAREQALQASISQKDAMIAVVTRERDQACEQREILRERCLSLTDENSKLTKNIHRNQDSLLSKNRELNLHNQLSGENESLRKTIDVLHKQVCLMGELQDQYKNEVWRLNLSGGPQMKIGVAQERASAKIQMLELEERLRVSSGSLDAALGRISDLEASLRTSEKQIEERRREVGLIRDMAAETTRAVETRCHSLISTNQALEQFLLERNERIDKLVRQVRRSQRGKSVGSDGLDDIDVSVGSPPSGSVGSGPSSASSPPEFDSLNSPSSIMAKQPIVLNKLDVLAEGESEGDAGPRRKT